MIYAHDFAEEPVEDPCREYELPESDEVESKRYAFERCVAFYGVQDFTGHVLRFQDRDYRRLYSVQARTIHHIIQTALKILIVRRKDKIILPLIMAAISMAQKKAQSENQDLQNMANNMRQPLQIQQPQQQFPTINSVFGNR